MHRPSSLLWPPQPLLSSLPLPSSVRKPPAVFEWKPDLSSLVCMLRWDVPASLSRSLYSPFIPKHKYYLPHVFVSHFQFFFSPQTLTHSFCFFISLSVFLPFNSPSTTTISTSRSPVDHQRANDVINCSLVIVIDSWHCRGREGGGTSLGQPVTAS